MSKRSAVRRNRRRCSRRHARCSSRSRKKAGRRSRRHFRSPKDISAEMRRCSPDALVLGCTHYPILRDVIQQTVGENVTLIDSGEATAEEVAKLLDRKGFGQSRTAVAGTRGLCDDLDHFYVTDAAERFARVAERFLGSQPSKLEAIEVYGSDELENDKFNDELRQDLITGTSISSAIRRSRQTSRRMPRARP